MWFEPGRFDSADETRCVWIVRRCVGMRNEGEAGVRVGLEEAGVVKYGRM